MNAVNEIHSKFLTFRKIAVYYLVSRKTVHSAIVASIASPIVTKTLTALSSRVRRLNILYMILFPMGPRFTPGYAVYGGLRGG